MACAVAELKRQDTDSPQTLSSSVTRRRVLPRTPGFWRSRLASGSWRMAGLGGIRFRTGSEVFLRLAVCAVRGTCSLPTDGKFRTPFRAGPKPGRPDAPLLLFDLLRTGT